MSASQAARPCAHFQMTWQVVEADLDAYAHVNNIAYLRWCETIAWEHSKQNGLDIADFEAHDCALMVHKHECEYLASAYLGDDLTVHTWIDASDGRISFWRQYAMVNQNGVCVFRGRTRWVSVSLKTGKLKRMPASYADSYPVSDTPAFD